MDNESPGTQAAIPAEQLVPSGASLRNLSTVAAASSG
jgi:hypothetical protein